MYQYTTHYPLCDTKVYVESVKDCVKYFVNCVRFTQDYRKKKGMSKLHWGDIESAHRLISIDENEVDHKRVMGSEKENSTEHYDYLEKIKSQKVKKNEVESEILTSIIKESAQKGEQP